MNTLASMQEKFIVGINEKFESEVSSHGTELDQIRAKFRVFSIELIKTFPSGLDDIENDLYPQQIKLFLEHLENAQNSFHKGYMACVLSGCLESH